MDVTSKRLEDLDRIPAYIHDLPAYEYEPLQRDPIEIRILILEPSLEHKSPLHISFQRAHIASKDVYLDAFEALSYTWGEPALIHPVVAHSTHKLRITDNLDQALRALRLQTEQRRLWVDALCINQRDDGEKSRQIPLMHEIFRSARTVLAWLGADGKEEAIGMTRLSWFSRLSIENFADRAIIEKLQEGIREEGIAAVLNLPWFTRMWIIQEVVFNIDVTLVYGSITMSWVRFSTASGVYKMIRDAKNRFDKVDQQLEAIAMISKLWKLHSMSVDRPQEFQILDLLRRFAHYQCSDPRDRIHALYNMATDMQRSWNVSGTNYWLSHIPFAVDYSLDIKDTFHSFALSCVRANRIAQLLQAVAERARFDVSPDWASWVPDWRRTPMPRDTWFPEALIGSIEAPLSCVGHDQSKLLLLSRFCCSSTSHTLAGEPFVNIDSIEPGIAIVDNVDDFLRSLMKLHYEVSPNYRIWWISETKFMARTLASLLDLSADITDALETCLSKDGKDEINNSASEKKSKIRVAIYKSMEGRTWFRAVMPGRTTLFYGITSTDIEVGDKLLVDSRLVVEAEERSTVSAIVIRPNMRTKGQITSLLFPDLSTHSFRVLGGALLSCPLQARSVVHDESDPSAFVRPTDLFAGSVATLCTEARFWLE